jgi:enoyl-CoA hydratase/carnithine racemase
MSAVPGTATTLAWPDPAIAVVTMTRAAEMNTLTLELLAEFGAALDAAEKRRARAMIVTGSGRAFCCGAHLKYFTDRNSPIGRTGIEVRDNYLQKIALLFDRIEMMPFPVIAAINGYALGGGCEMALACDFRLMADGAKLGLPEIRIGATPGAGGVQKLQRHIGRGKALEWILLGKHIDAAEAERHDLLYARCAPDRLLDAALALAHDLKKLPPRAIAQAKASVHVSADVDLRSARRYGLEALALLVDGEEWREGMSAFVEKRAPRF